MAWSAIRKPTHYEVLGVPQSATSEDIGVAYRAALLRLHPDKADSREASTAAGADAGFVRIREAGEVGERLSPSI